MSASVASKVRYFWPSCFAIIADLYWFDFDRICSTFWVRFSIFCIENHLSPSSSSSVRQVGAGLSLVTFEGVPRFFLSF